MKPQNASGIGLGRRRKDGGTWLSWLRGKQPCLVSALARNVPAKFYVFKVYGVSITA